MKTFAIKGVFSSGKDFYYQDEAVNELAFRNYIKAIYPTLRITHLTERKNSFWCKVIGHKIPKSQWALYEAQTIAHRFKERTLICNRCFKIIE